MYIGATYRLSRAIPGYGGGTAGRASASSRSRSPSRRAAALLAAPTGEDPRAPATRGSAAHALDYTRFLDADALRGPRPGIARKRYAGSHSAVDQLFETALGVLRERGAVIADPVDLTTDDHLADAEGTVLSFEVKADLDAYLAALGPDAHVRTMADVIAFNERNAERELALFGQEHFVRAQARGTLPSPEYLRALARCRRYARTLGIDAVMSRHRVDAIVCPTATPRRHIDHVNGDGGGGADCTTPAAVAGCPHITVPTSRPAAHAGRRGSCRRLTSDV